MKTNDDSSSGYRSVLLVPLGDDFRFDRGREWDQQMNNHQKLFDYINAKDEWNTEVNLVSYVYQNMRKIGTGKEQPQTLAVQTED